MARKRAKKRKLEATVARIHARFGPRSLTRGRLPASTPTSRLPTSRSGAAPHISTGFPKLDALLGIGGLPQGKACEIVGLPTSGKTTLALKFLAQAQAEGTGQVAGQVAYIDQARYFDADYAHRCGIDLSRLVVAAPYGLDETLAVAESLVRSESLAALVFDAMDDLWSNSHAAAQLASFLHRLPGPLARSGTVLLFVHAAQGTRSTPLAHHAAVRLQVTRERWLRHQQDVRGYEARVEVLKNRLGPSGRSITLSIEFNGTVRGNGL
jgi:recombination protein RecA